MPQDPIVTPEDESEEELLDLRYVGEHQLACPGVDLIEMLNCDDAVGPALYARLGLTPQREEALDFDYLTFAELRPEAYYMLSFPEGTDFSDFSVAQALAIEEISETRFNELPTDDDDGPCDGDCEHCPQDCIGKRPVIDA